MKVSNMMQKRDFDRPSLFDKTLLEIDYDNRFHLA